MKEGHGREVMAKVDVLVGHARRLAVQEELDLCKIYGDYFSNPHLFIDFFFFIDPLFLRI